MKAVEIRDDLVRVLRLDLIGPEPGSTHETETLEYAPASFYLAGFLAPRKAEPRQRSDEGSREEIANGSDGGGADDETTPEPPSSRRLFLPSSMGVSILVRAAAKTIRVRARWGDYKKQDGDPARPTWKRTPRSDEVVVNVAATTEKIVETALPSDKGLIVVTSVRPVAMPADQAGAVSVPAGTRSVSIFLVNNRSPAPDEQRDEAFIFQAELELRLETGFVPRPDLRGQDGNDWDERVADLQCRDACEHSVGHGVSTAARVDPDGECREVVTTWVPSAQVEKVEPGEVPGVELSMEALAAATTGADVRAKVGAIVTAYAAWIEAQRAAAPPDGKRGKVAKELFDAASFARGRIGRGLEALDTPDVLDAFRTANRTMAKAARQRYAAAAPGNTPAAAPPPAWRPFQLAFLLMNLVGVADPFDAEREIVDLLFFPTGGGKTEAYFGLAAFALVLRRLRNPGVASAGLSVLMRYTLRLLTLDQLGRAAALICALELERQQDVERLGTWPFEIGLWVGQAATPNRMGKKGDKDQYTARKRTTDYQNDDRKPSPIPIENCPWCGQRFNRNSFILVPNPDQPTDLRISCSSRACPFHGNRPLPIVAVDEPIYRRLPCFLIATVDKFANLPWVGPTGALFGKVERHDKDGFYGPCDPGRGKALEKPLPPPDLIIQDELHLISGPLGTMVGLYETAIDALSTRQVDGKRVRPKIVASTATVRRAEAQIRALFGRQRVEVFPPPGPDRRDSFFAKTVTKDEKSARRYVGIAAQGRSLKVVLLRAYLALLTAAKRAYAAEGGDKKTPNSADPYMTLVGYFGSLRELGGTRRIVEDEVTARVQGYSRRKRVGEAKGEFADRKIQYEVVELTSRESTNKVADAKRRLALPFPEKDAVDVALATNMISVGLDITRLGLMVVLGQPKTTAEYIQATSRVGRDDERPGLVLTLLNVHKPRDRSHYERFESYHATFYRAVEATSATPFSPRAVDRGLAAVTVALARHTRPELTAPARAIGVSQERQNLNAVADEVGLRAGAHDRTLTAPEANELREKVRGRVIDLLDEWVKIADQRAAVGAGLQYQREQGGEPPLLYAPLDPELATKPPGAKKFKAQRSLRDVEPSVNIWVRQLDGIDVEADEE